MKIKKVSANGKKVQHEQLFRFPRDVGRVESVWASCQEDQQGDTVYQVVMLASDGSLHSITPNGNALWRREEALASLAEVELLPMQSAAAEEAEDDMPAYLARGSGSTGSTDVLEQFVR